MARVDFYVLDRVDERSRQLLACKLAEKAYRLKNTVYIHAKSAADAKHLDELLWTFRDGSFVPHGIVGSGEEAAAAPVVIGHPDKHADSSDLLINLCDDIPPFANAFPRVAELVTSDETCRQASRKRFAAYRDQGHTLNTYSL